METDIGCWEHWALRVLAKDLLALLCFAFWLAGWLPQSCSEHTLNISPDDATRSASDPAQSSRKALRPATIQLQLISTSFSRILQSFILSLAHSLILLFNSTRPVRISTLSRNFIHHASRLPRSALNSEVIDRSLT